MDSDEEWFKREARETEPFRVRRRNRALGAILLGALGAGLVFVVMEGFDRARNPCNRVRDHYCAQNPASTQCKTYTDLAKDSVTDDSAMARQSMLHQCETLINRLAIDEGVKVK